jgi:hypothetical protein
LATPASLAAKYWRCSVRPSEAAGNAPVLGRARRRFGVAGSHLVLDGCRFGHRPGAHSEMDGATLHIMIGWCPSFRVGVALRLIRSKAPCTRCAIS